MTNDKLYLPAIKINSLITICVAFRMRVFKAGVANGFTLIELLVVIALMSILMLSSISIFSSYTRSQSFQTSISDVVAFIDKAKSRSLNQVKPEQCSLQTLHGYRVSFDRFGSDYTLEVLCDSDIYILETKELPSQVTFGEGTADFVLFNISTGIVTIPAEVIVAGSGNEKTISIDGVGNVSVK